ncbi:hypothetical protein [Nocardiopsis dassonvillei]|uniref:hypothetical protein n=1 Tax=Nocardiopsis dassonvillei TaxID=2014 RepID=UPI00363DCB11
MKPEKKVVAAAGGGGVALALVWIVQALGYDMPLAVAEGLVLAVALVAAWITPHTHRPEAK